MTSRVQWSYRDVSTLLQTFRNFLLGRKHTLHPRFPCAIAPRSIPRPDIPRNMDYKYSEQYYVNRNSKDSVYPPVVAPIAMGAKGDTILKAESVSWIHSIKPNKTALLLVVVAMHIVLKHLLLFS